MFIESFFVPDSTLPMSFEDCLNSRSSEEVRGISSNSGGIRDMRNAKLCPLIPGSRAAKCEIFVLNLELGFLRNANSVFLISVGAARAKAKSEIFISDAE